MFPSHSPAIYDFLKEQRLVAPDQLDALNEEHKATGKPLADVVVDLGIVDKNDLLERIAIQEYTQLEVALQLAMPPRNVVRRYEKALDTLTRLFLDRRLLRPLQPCQDVENPKSAATC